MDGLGSLCGVMYRAPFGANKHWMLSEMWLVRGATTGEIWQIQVTRNHQPWLTSAGRWGWGGRCKIKVSGLALVSKYGEIAKTPAGLTCFRNEIWQGSSVTRGNAYRVYVAAFLITLGPFAFFNLSKTKYLQVAIFITVIVNIIIIIIWRPTALSNSLTSRKKSHFFARYHT